MLVHEGVEVPACVRRTPVVDSSSNCDAGSLRLDDAGSPESSRRWGMNQGMDEQSMNGNAGSTTGEDGLRLVGPRAQTHTDRRTALFAAADSEELASLRERARICMREFREAKLSGHLSSEWGDAHFAAYRVSVEQERGKFARRLFMELLIDEMQAARA